ncbi:MAG TPA: nucleotidyltransferase domain-containing protein [Candidatus Dormibacteraeota bacterium]|jgi:hypothetical protein|nr:nucleotidyltransferase domain-containing protein [Candidatus Dormibacteraeota bacterium]
MQGDWRTRYPLTGIREATTEPQERLLRRSVGVLRSDPRILAAWLVGSFASGRADAYSDIDVHCCVEDEALDAFRGDGWKEVLARITPTVMATTFPPTGPVGGYSLTPEWTHIDLVVHPRSSMNIEAEGPLRPLFDHTGELLPGQPPPPDPPQGEPYFPEPVVDFYFYILGNMVTVVARNEPALLGNGVITLRDACLVPLLCAERGVRRSGGAKRVRPFLSPDQYELVCSLPPIAGTLDGCIDANLALASIFIPRGRSLAARVGARWPGDLERATVRHVERGLGVRLDL